MPEYRRQFRVQVLTPTGQVCSCDAVSVVFPASDGMAGVLGGRAPLVAMLGAGPLEVEQPDGKRRRYYLSGGFAQVRSDQLTVLAEQCSLAGDLNPQEVLEEIEQVRNMPADSPAATQRRRELLAAERVKLRMARAQQKGGEGQAGKHAEG